MSEFMISLRLSRPHETDAVFAESEGEIDRDPVVVQVTCKGLFLCVLRNGEEHWFGVDLSELARNAAAEIEGYYQKRRRG